MAEISNACTLSPDAQTVRLAEIRTLLHQASLGAERLPDGVIVQFSKTDATRAALDRLIAAESDCCSFLSFDLSEEETALRLVIHSPHSFVSSLQGLFGVAAQR
jgi:hypothetical protein